MAAPLHAHGARAGRRAVRRSRRGPGRRRAVVVPATSTARATAFARHLAAGASAPATGWRVMTANRAEFVVAVHGISKLGAAAVLLSPAWKAVEVGHAVELTGPVHAVADGAAAAAAGRAPRGRPGHRPRRPRRRPPPASAEPPPERRSADRRRPTRRCWCSARARPGCPRRCATRTRRWATPPTTGARRSASAPTTGSRWPRRRRTSSACSTCSPRRRPAPPCGCTAASTSTRCCAASRPSG